jgi:acyl-coenzyme A synthetase/AMP-(fatty) acid ligase
VLNTHPAVAHSAVIGRTTRGDEEIVAFVQPSPGLHLTETEVSEFAAKRLAPYKRPSEILIVATMPMTSSGKIAKSDLAKIAENMKQATETRPVASG